MFEFANEYYVCSAVAAFAHELVYWTSAERVMSE